MILPNQPDVFRRPDLPAFDGLPQLDCAYCGALRVARTLRDMYATEGLDLEEVGLAHTMESLLYIIPQKWEAAFVERHDGGERQGVLMGSILLYTTMKIPTVT